MILIIIFSMLEKQNNIKIVAINIIDNSPGSLTLANIRVLSSPPWHRASRLLPTFSILLGEEGLQVILTATDNSTLELEYAESRSLHLTLWNLIALAPSGHFGTCRATHEDVY